MDEADHTVSGVRHTVSGVAAGVAWFAWFAGSILVIMRHHTEPWVYNGQPEPPGWYGPYGNAWLFLVPVVGFFSAFVVAAVAGMLFDGFLNFVVRFHTWWITYHWATHGQYLPGVRADEFKRVFFPNKPIPYKHQRKPNGQIGEVGYLCYHHEYEHIFLCERAHTEDRKWLSGDPLAMYGGFPPHEMFRPMPLEEIADAAQACR